MSTRSQTKIICKNKSVMLYHHSDGYPEGLGFFLLKLMEDTLGRRYQIESEEIATELLKKTDYELSNHSNHSDIEYFYEFNIDKKCVSCFRVNNWSGNMEIEQTIDLKALYEKIKEQDVELYSEYFK